MLKPHIKKLSAYSPPLEGRKPQQDLLLDFNERTLPLSRVITDALVSFIHDNQRLNLYPAYGDIVNRLADYTDINPSNIMITNGSDQGIELVFRSVHREESSEAIIPGPSFAMYAQCAKVEGMKIVEPLYSRDQGYPLEEVLAAINDKTAIVVVSNPNNPCGTAVSISDIAKIAKAASKAAILVDECYFEYSQLTATALLDEYDNIFITRTFSKTWGLPSLRFGYLISQPENILSLLNVRGPYDINQLAVVAADAALSHPNYTHEYVNEVMNKAKPLLESWLDEHKISYWASHANYIWVFFKEAEEVSEYLLNCSIRVRPKMYQQDVGLRITVGTVDQMHKTIACLEAYLKKQQEAL